MFFRLNDKIIIIKIEIIQGNNFPQNIRGSKYYSHNYNQSQRDYNVLSEIEELNQNQPESKKNQNQGN